MVNTFRIMLNMQRPKNIVFITVILIKCPSSHLHQSLKLEVAPQIQIKHTRMVDIWLPYIVLLKLMFYIYSCNQIAFANTDSYQ